MATPTSVAFGRFVWIVLTSMMLVSRVLFSRRGAVGMRAFLDRWKVSVIRRIWGLSSVVIAGCALVLVARDVDALRGTDWVMLTLLVAILVADGLVNVLPSGFTTFKDRVQASWVKRHDESRADDRSLFGTINLVLAAAAGGWELAVILYRPISAGTVATAIAVALVLTPALITAADRVGPAPAR